jgi:RNA polymerase sigma-70 factor (ECF subfamily)
MSAKFDPSDVGQTAIVDVARDIQSFRGRSREFFGWLRQIVHHNAIDLQRRHARSAEKEVLIDSGLHDIPALSDADPVLRMEEIEQVAKVLEKLSKDHKAVLRLRVWDDLKWEEIGRKLNRSADASRQLFARAIDAVRGDLEDDAVRAGRGV